MIKFSRSKKYNLKTGKSRAKRYHKRMQEKTNWSQLGYDMASGKKGTRWMAYNKGDIEDSSSYGISSLEEVADEYAQSWATDTEQWQYEVGNKIREEIGPEIKDGEINDDYFDAQNEWVAGYSSYILKVERNIKR